MTAKILNCKELSNKIKEGVKEQVALIYEKTGLRPILTTFLVGDNPASKVYVRNKIRSAEFTGIEGRLLNFPENVAEDALLAELREQIEDPRVNGILVQLPVPPHISEQKITDLIPYTKDADGFHPINLGRIMIGRPFLEPCTPAGIIEIFKHFKIDTQGKDIVIIGRSNIVSKPLMNMLVQKNEFANATVTVCHSYTRDITFYTRHADIVITAVGKAGFLTAGMVKPGVVVIDVGMNRVHADNEKGYRLVGDADFDGLLDKASAITPVPGGVGLMTVSMLMKMCSGRLKPKTGFEIRHSYLSFF